MLKKTDPIEDTVRLDAFRDVPDFFLVNHEGVLSDGNSAYSVKYIEEAADTTLAVEIETYYS